MRKMSDKCQKIILNPNDEPSNAIFGMFTHLIYEHMILYMNYYQRPKKGQKGAKKGSNLKCPKEYYLFIITYTIPINHI